LTAGSSDSKVVAMGKKETMEQKLRAAFAPVQLTIIDESHKHQGHAGWHEGGETHFRVEIVSSAFSGLTRVERQRRVHQALADELAGGVHALALRAAAPGE
jgi:BolA family transcriptional regulator, general stress-responsive regulator